MALHGDELSIQHSERTKNRMPFKELSETLNFTECCKTMAGSIQHGTVWVECVVRWKRLYKRTHTYEYLRDIAAHFELINSTHFVCNVRAAHTHTPAPTRCVANNERPIEMARWEGGNAVEMWHSWVNESNNGISQDKGVVRFSFLWQSWLRQRTA